MPVADTSFLIAFFDLDDPRHSETKKWFANTDHVVVSTEILVETLGVLKSKIGRKAAESAVEILLGIENVGWEENCDLMASYRIYKRRKTGSLMDAMVIHLCNRLDTTPLTYDEKQASIVKEMQG